jgi:hypothetical protein
MNLNFELIYSTKNRLASDRWIQWETCWRRIHPTGAQHIKELKIMQFLFLQATQRQHVVSEELDYIAAPNFFIHADAMRAFQELSEELWMFSGNLSSVKALMSDKKLVKISSIKINGADNEQSAKIL